MILRRFLGWDECAPEEYAACAERYGFNNESSARFLTYCREQGADLRFLAYRRRGESLGAVCLDGGWLANDHKNPRLQTTGLPLPAFSIIPPFQQGVTCIAPFKTKSLSSQCRNFSNTSFTLLSKREVAYARCVEQGFSKKARYNRNREVRRFLEAGGEFVSVREIAAEFLYDSYQQLFAKRRQRDVTSVPAEKAFFIAHHQDFFGSLALFNGVPVGVQLLISSTSRLGLFVDFINIGYDTDITEHSLGTIMMWHNLVSAHQQADALQLPLWFSYGMMSGEYKAMWCTPSRNGRMIAF